ncbi:MAG: zinc ribbon domain-containing protein [Candidatus Thermoplasmatota archaeon]
MVEPNASSNVGTVVKAKKAPRMTYKQEIQTIQNLPKVQRFIVIIKIAGVFLVAIGLEGIVTGNYVYTAVFIPLGMFVSLMPIKIRTDRCIACQTPLTPGQSICPSCGAPQM